MNDRSETSARSEVSTTAQAVTQAEGLDVHETDDGLVVYDPGRDRVHYLNETAAAVFVLADPSATISGLVDEVASIWELDEAPTDQVERCVAQLLDEGILRSVPG